MFLDSAFIGLFVMSCIRKNGNALERVGQMSEETHKVPAWLKNATSDYIRPMMSEFSLLMRLNDEHVQNTDCHVKQMRDTLENMSTLEKTGEYRIGTHIGPMNANRLPRWS
jgi:hypothetical protein